MNVKCYYTLSRRYSSFDNELEEYVSPYYGKEELDSKELVELINTLQSNSFGVSFENSSDMLKMVIHDYGYTLGELYFSVLPDIYDLADQLDDLYS